MTERSTVEKFATLATIEEPSQKTERPRAKLLMMWELDPGTGKLVARWVAEGANLIENLQLDSAA